MDFLDIKVLLEELVQCCQSPDISVSEWAERWYALTLRTVILPKVGDNVQAEAETLCLTEDWRCCQCEK